MTQKISIIIVITGLNSGGAEAMLVKILGRIDKALFNLEVISLTTKGDKGNIISALGIPVYEMRFERRVSSIFKIFALISYLRKKNPDIVHTWMYHSDLIGGLCAYFAGVKRIAWCIRQSNLLPSYSKVSTIIIVKICSYLSNVIPDKILVCSNNSLDVHAALGYNFDRMIVVQNGFDLDIFKKNEVYREMFRKEHGIDDDTIVIGMVARFDPQKNHAGFIKAAYKVKKKIQNIMFVLVGDRVDLNNSELVHEVSRYNICENVLFLGKRNDINIILNGIDILALPSLYGEGFPNIIGEAMACEVPCVATNLGDCAEVIGDINFIADPMDMENFSQKLISLCLLDKDKREALGKKLRRQIIDNYEISHITSLYQNFYINLMKE